MSQDYFTKILTDALQNLKNVTEQDRQATNKDPYKDREEAKQKIGNLYLSYAVLSNKLCDVCEEIRDPLIAEYVQKYYEATVSRALQLNQELCRLLAEEATDLDGEIIRLALTPFDIRLKIPGFYVRKREHDIQKRQNYFKRLSVKDESEGSSLATKSEVTSTVLEKSVTQTEIESGSLEKSMTQTEIERESLERSLAPTEIEREKLFISKNRMIQAKCIHTYQEMYKKAVERVQKLYKLRFEENIEDELRDWCEDFYTATGAFPPFPSPALVELTGKTFGIPKKFQQSFPSEPYDLPKSAFVRDFCCVRKLAGSALIPAGYWITPEEWMVCQKLGKQKQKKKKKAKPKKKGKKVSKGFQLQPTEFFKIEKLLRSRDCSRVSEEGIESDAIYNTALEIRADVDASFRDELDLLEGALHKDKFPKRKRRKRKDRKAKKRGKKGKGILRDVTTEQCIEELVATGIFRDGYGSRLHDYMSDFDYTGQTPNGKLVDLLLQRCILPLSSLAVHQLSPLTRSICLTGPEHSAKQFLIDAVVTATGAAVFDMSSEVTSVYSKNELKRLIAVVNRLSRELQPSVIFIRNIEKIFYKKVPAKEKPLKPKQLQPYIRKLVKGIKASDQVLLMATSSQPWLAKRNKLMKCIDRFFYVPSTHYGTHALYWRSLLGELRVVPALAKISSGQGHPYKFLEETVGYDGTIDQLAAKPEFNGKKFDKFMKQTPQGKAKRKLLAEDQKKKK